MAIGLVKTCTPKRTDRRMNGGTDALSRRVAIASKNFPPRSAEALFAETDFETGALRRLRKNRVTSGRRKPMHLLDSKRARS